MKTTHSAFVSILNDLLGKALVDSAGIVRATEMAAVELFMKGETETPRADRIHYQLAALRSNGVFDFEGSSK